MTHFNVSGNRQATALAAAEHIQQLIEKCVAQKGICHIVLPGGSTPADCLKILASKPLPWERLHWYPSDERCLPKEHADRNDTMIRAHLLANPEARKSTNLHSMPAELGPKQAAEKYMSIIKSLLKNEDHFDIALLGMGEDGHTASLFPGSAALEDDRLVIPVENAAKPPPERVTLGVIALKNAHRRLVLATGSDKSAILKKAVETSTLPISLIRPDHWFLDLEIYAGLNQT